MSSVKEVRGPRVGPGRDLVKLMSLRFFVWYKKSSIIVLTWEIGVLLSAIESGYEGYEFRITKGRTLGFEEISVKGNNRSCCLIN